MAKEKPRFKAIKEYEEEFKKEYSRTMGLAFQEVFNKIEKYSHQEKKVGKEVKL